MINDSNDLSSNVAIIIPIYQKFQLLEKSELQLLEQIKNVFKNREILIILPESLEEDWKQKIEFQTIRFSDSYFKDKFSYSKLLCRKQFYQSFSDFDYIQIIQTDCWIFEDKLDYFTSLGHDYIGAPWMVGGFDGYPEEKLWKTGNGGFSLRRVSSFISILEQIEHTPKGKMAVFKSNHRSPKAIIKNLGIRNNLNHYIKEAPGEDIFWCTYVPKIFNPSEFKIADTVTAAHYAFEVLPQFLFEKVTNGKLPMGCHNWINNNPSFWKNHIKY
jgi:hypothetical protein